MSQSGSEMKLTSTLDSLTLTTMQKRAVMRLAVDLAKSDKQIHESEVALLNECQRVLCLSSDELEMIHYLSLQECLSVLEDLSTEDKEAIISLLEQIVEIDVDIDRRERILLSAVRMALSDRSSKWAGLFSVTGVEAECSPNQIIYLEKHWCRSSREVLDDDFNNLLLTKALNDVGLQLFYFPTVKKKIDVSLLCRSMEYILPSENRAVTENMIESLDKIDSVSLFSAFCSTYRMSPGAIGYDAFLMLKLQEGEMLNDEGRLSRCIDFLCIDVSEEIKERVACFVGLLDAPVRKLSYEGYYRLLYDHLISASAVVSSVYIDKKNDFYLTDVGNQKLRFESAPQAKTLYLLLLHYGAYGVTQECFEKAISYLDQAKGEANWDYDTFRSRLEDEDSQEAVLIRKIMTIYERVSTKDPSNDGFLNYITTIIRQRSALKNYINKGFRSATHLSEKEDYCVKFNQGTKSYFVSTDISLFSIDEGEKQASALIDSRLWKLL